MCRATGGVNTHKGAIFFAGTACASLGHGATARRPCARNAGALGEMTGAQMRRELEAAKAGQARTFGEAIYQKAGVGGVRAEAASGFASRARNRPAEAQRGAEGRAFAQRRGSVR